jgi:predicted transposase/invertase (TIGR01784 family)
MRDFEFNFIELPKFKKSEEELESTLDKWIYFLKYADDLKVIPEKLSEPKEISEAFEIAEQHNWTKAELDFYDSWEMRRASEVTALESAIMQGIKIGKEEGIKIGEERGEKRGIKIGKEEGERQKAIEIAKNLLSLNLEIERIMQATGLTREEIERLMADKSR